MTHLLIEYQFSTKHIFYYTEFKWNSYFEHNTVKISDEKMQLITLC